MLLRALPELAPPFRDEDGSPGLMVHVWLVAQAARYAFALSESAKAAVSRLRLVDTGAGEGHWNESAPVIAMHVRRGDACDSFTDRRGTGRRGRPCYPLKLYMADAERLRKAYGSDTIHLATDAEAVVREAAGTRRDGASDTGTGWAATSWRRRRAGRASSSSAS